MRVRVAVDNLLELIAGGLLITGIAIIVGLGPALLAAAFVVAMLAEFSFAGHTWSVRLGLPHLGMSKDERARRLVRRQLKRHNPEMAEQMRITDEARRLHEVSGSAAEQEKFDRYTEIRVPQASKS